MTGRAHTNPALLMSMLDEQPTSIERSNIRVIPDFNPRLPMTGEGDPFSAEALADLTESIRQMGILQPILVRPAPGGTYELIAGERRFHAAGYAGLREVPVLVRELSDDEARMAAITENGQRLAIPYAQEALMGLRDIARRTHLPVTEVPALLNRLKNGADDEFGVAEYLRVAFGESVSTWAQRRALVLKLSPAEFSALNDRLIGVATLQLLLKLNDRPERQEFLQRLLDGQLSAEGLATAVQELLKARTGAQSGPKDPPLQQLRRSLPRLGKLSGDQADRANALIAELLQLLD